jgi:hypothetical protein
LLVLLGYYYHSIKTLDADSIDEHLSIIQVGINILLLISHQSIYLTKKCIMDFAKIIIIGAYTTLVQVVYTSRAYAPYLIYKFSETPK